MGCHRTGEVYWRIYASLGLNELLAQLRIHTIVGQKKSVKIKKGYLNWYIGVIGNTFEFFNEIYSPDSH